MILKARADVPCGPEVRSYPAGFEVRGLTGTSVEVNGYASTFGKPYEMYDAYGMYTETVRSGAFTKTLQDGADVAFLANHDGLTLARTRAGSLTLAADLEGLRVTARLNTARQDARDLLTAIEDGDVDQMSFGFRVVRQEWSPDYLQRDLVELNLDRGDVSAVNFGANPTTSINLQRAFRGRRPAEIHRMAVEVREGKTLSAATSSVLAQVLDLVAAADRSVDEAQPLLADLLGVPNPDEPEEPSDMPEQDAARIASWLDLERRREQERRARIA